MAFPFIVEENFDAGTLGGFDSESDTGSLLDYPHYSTLSRQQTAPIPYRGAYCMRILPGDTNDHTVTEGAIDIADEATAYFRWYMFVSSDFTATADDLFNIFELQQAGGTREASVGMSITAATGALTIGIGDGAAPSDYVTFPRNEWVCVELAAKISTTGAGTLTLFLNEASQIALTGLTNAAAVGTGVLGTQDTLATTGVGGGLYFDQFVMDDARIYSLPIRYPENLLMTKSGHAFVGTGTVENVSLLSGAATDNVLQIFDTDQGNILHTGRMKLELKNVVAEDVVDPAGVPVQIQRGCYVVLTGTNPRAMISIGLAQGYYSNGRIRQHGVQWKNTPMGW